MGSLQLVVDGVALTSVAGWGDVEWSTNTHGSDELSFAVNSTKRTVLRGRKRIQLYEGGLAIWSGTLNEPDQEAGTFRATGLWQLAENTPALDGGGVVTMIPDTAIDAAIARGALPGWSRPASVSGSAVSSDTLGEVPSLAQLLDAYADAASVWWAINAHGQVWSYSKPAYSMVHTIREAPGISDEGYVTALLGRRRTNTGGYTTELVVDTAAAARWGYREQTIDLTKLGYITALKAQNIMQGQLDKGRARLGFSHSFEVTRATLLTAGGIGMNTRRAIAGKTLRFPLWDATRELNGRPYLDVLIGRTTHRQNDPVAELEPWQMAAVSIPDVLTTLKGA